MPVSRDEQVVSEDVVSILQQTGLSPCLSVDQTDARLTTHHSPLTTHHSPLIARTIELPVLVSLYCLCIVFVISATEHQHVEPPQ